MSKYINIHEMGLAVCVFGSTGVEASLLLSMTSIVLGL